MKRFIKNTVLILLLGFTFAGAPSEKVQAQVSFQIFYDGLSPYGQWVSFPEEGYVWIPTVSAGFSPYSTNGYWTFTDYGWMWVSNYPWGWAPFHYGRWDFDDEYGWYWVPDYEWAPAWVAWSREPGYYGWAPLRPGIEVNYAITNGYYFPTERWCYAPAEFLGSRDIERHCVPRSENVVHIKNSQMVNKTYLDNSRHTVYMGGPAREEVEKSTGAPVKQLVVAPRTSPGQSVGKSNVSIYRPEVTRATAADPKPAPRKLSERTNAAPSMPAQQTAPRNNTAPASEPVARQQNKIASPPATPSENRTMKQVPKEIPATAPPNRTAPPPAPPQQPPQQKAEPKRDRQDRYSPPHYEAPKSSQPPPQHEAAPRQAPQPVAHPPQQRANEQPRQAPPPRQNAPNKNSEHPK